VLQLSATNSMHAELIEDDGESRYKVTDIIGKPGVTKYCSFIKITGKRNEPKFTTRNDNAVLNRMSPFYPIRSKASTNRDSFAEVFRALRQLQVITYTLSFWLVHRPLWLSDYFSFGTQLKPAL